MDPSPDIATLMRQFYQAAATSDISSIERLLSQQAGILFIGTDPTEWWADYGALQRAFAAQTLELDGLQLQEQALVAYREGRVGWAADRPTLRLPDGRELPLRLAAVFHQEGSAWKLVQGHLSIGVKNEVVVGQELTV